MGYAIYGPWEDNLNRLETAFYQQVRPHLIDTPFRFPKVYFAGKNSNHVVITYKIDSNYQDWCFIVRPKLSS